MRIHAWVPRFWSWLAGDSSYQEGNESSFFKP
jgi:hypothetical protein